LSKAYNYTLAIAITIVIIDPCLLLNTRLVI